MTGSWCNTKTLATLKKLWKLGLMLITAKNMLHSSSFSWTVSTSWSRWTHIRLSSRLTTLHPWDSTVTQTSITKLCCRCPRQISSQGRSYLSTRRLWSLSSRSQSPSSFATNFTKRKVYKWSLTSQRWQSGKNFSVATMRARITWATNFNLLRTIFVKL